MHLTKVTHLFTESKSPQGYMVGEDLSHKQFYDNDIHKEWPQFFF